jgi:hypothetical protein
MTTTPTLSDRLLAIEDTLFRIESRLKLALGYEDITPTVPRMVLDDLAEMQQVRDQLYSLIDLDDLTPTAPEAPSPWHSAVAGATGGNIVTHRDAAIDIGGTCLRGILSDVPYASLVALLGTPLPGDDDKSSAEWHLRFRDGSVGTIYDWKTAPCYLGPDGVPAEQQTRWHIGAAAGDYRTVGRIQALFDAPTE